MFSRVLKHIRVPYHSSSSRSFVSSAPSFTSITELREYKLIPGQAAKYIQHTTEYASVRHELVPTRLFSLPETGGQLHVATHLYHYDKGYEHRDEARSLMPKDERWVEYLGLIRPLIQEQHSTCFTEAPLVQDFSLHGMANGSSPGQENSDGSSTSYELRRYQLRLGYDTVPKFLEYYAQGLPSKLNAHGTDPSTSLVTVLYNDTGSLNEVIEIWRHGDGTKAMGISREAARGAVPWRKAITKIAGLALHFQSTIHKPVAGNGLSKWL